VGQEGGERRGRESEEDTWIGTDGPGFGREYSEPFLVLHNFESGHGHIQAWFMSIMA
jgi:hypothetical protein